MQILTDNAAELHVVFWKGEIYIMCGAATVYCT